MSTRVPTRGAMMPAIGATNIGASVHGVVCTAASSGRRALHDLQVLDQDEHRAEHAEAEPEADDVRDREAAVAEQPQRQQRRLRARLPEQERGEQHARRRRARRAPRPSPSPRRCRARCRSTRPSTPSAGEHGAEDVDAQRGRRSRCGSTKSASGIARMPTGTLIQKIACQFQPSMIAPPTSGPTATPSPAMPPQMPIASGRRSGGDGAARAARARAA